MPSKFCCDELRKVLRQRHLNLIPFNSYGTAGDGDVRILRSFAGLDVVPPSVPGTFDDVAVQMAFSERSSRMWAGGVGGVGGSFEIEQGNRDPLNFDRPYRSRRDYL